MRSDRETGQVSRFGTYVVEYDLPADKRRKRFYRAIKKWRGDHHLGDTGWSTQSVVFTDHAAFAWLVWREARLAGGTSYIYEARRLDTAR